MLSIVYIGGILSERVNALCSVEWAIKLWKFPVPSIASLKAKLKSMMTDTVVAYPSQTLGKSVQETVTLEDGATRPGLK